MEKLIYFILIVIILFSSGVCCMQYFWDKLSSLEGYTVGSSKLGFKRWVSLIVFILSVIMCGFSLFQLSEILSSTHSKMYSHTYYQLYKDNRYNVDLDNIGYYDYVKLRFKKSLVLMMF